MTAAAPTCKTCTQRHFNFQPCPEAPVAQGTPDKFLRPREGARDFGNRFGTHTGRDYGGTVVSFIPRANHPMYEKPQPPKEAA